MEKRDPEDPKVKGESKKHPVVERKKKGYVFF